MEEFLKMQGSGLSAGETFGSLGRVLGLAACAMELFLGTRERHGGMEACVC